MKSRKDNVLYVAYPIDGVHLCGRCFHGIIREYRYRCLRCKAQNVAYGFEPPEITECRRRSWHLYGESL